MKNFANQAQTADRAAAAPGARVEPLEPRQLLAGVTLNAAGDLTLSGDNDRRNALTVTVSGSNYVAKVNAITQTFSSSKVKRVVVNGGNWNDTISLSSSVTKPSVLRGNDGDDSVSGGGGADTIYGGGKNDLLKANGGNDSVLGDSGNDNLDGGAGTDKLDGGTGTDTVKNGESTGVSAGPTAPRPAPAPSSLSVTSIELWNADTNKKIETLDGGETIDLAKTPSVTIVAFGGSGTNSVKFGLDSNGSYRIESGKPWSIAGDANGNLTKWNVSTGSHTVKVTPYSKLSGTGTAGASKSVSFKVIRSGETPAPSTGGGNTGGGNSGGNTGGGGSIGTGGIVPRNNAASAPSAVITAVSSKTIHAGQSFSAHAMSSALNGGTPLTARYVWDFGDAGSKYNTLAGFNASHFYAKAGTYTVKLSLTNEAGKTDVATTTVTVQAEGRKKIYVSGSGSDGNDGLSESKPIKSFSKAIGKLADNVEILFRGGDTFSVNDSMTIYKRNVVIGSYGSGKATLKYTGAKNYTHMLYLGGNGAGEATVENLIFDSIYTGQDKAGMPQAIGAGGVGQTVINNEFRNVGYAVNASAQPKGLLVQDNDAPLRAGLKEYFIWAQGQDLALLGNNISNTLYGHDIRSAGTDRFLIHGNTIRNPNDPAHGDNVNRGTINIHLGQYLYVSNNTITNGVTSIGPLGETTGVDNKGGRLKWAVLEGNNIEDSVLLVLHGTEHVMIRNNVLEQDNSWAIELEDFNSSYGRGVVDVSIVNNTGVNAGQRGNFLKVDGDVNGINLINNLYLAPNMVTGLSGSSPVMVYDTDLSSFRKIDGNVWPSPSIDKYAEGGINYVWSFWANADGYRTPSEWAAFGQVINDHFADTAHNGSFVPTSSSTAANAGVLWAGVFTDKNGKVRSNAGSWTAGAFEV